MILGNENGLNSHGQAYLERLRRGSARKVAPSTATPLALAAERKDSRELDNTFRIGWVIKETRTLPKTEPGRPLQINRKDAWE